MGGAESFFEDVGSAFSGAVDTIGEGFQTFGSVVGGGITEVVGVGGGCCWIRL